MASTNARAEGESKGDAPEARHEYGHTEFLYACLKGDPKSIAELAKAGCDTTAKANNGRTG